MKLEEKRLGFGRKQSLTSKRADRFKEIYVKLKKDQKGMENAVRSSFAAGPPQNQ